MNKTQPPIGQQPIRDARTLGLPKMLLLGLQHMFAMFGATVLVPILVQGYGLPLSIQTTLFFAGVGTLFFHVCTRLKVPAFLDPPLPSWGASRRWRRWTPACMPRWSLRKSCSIPAAASWWQVCCT